MISKITPSAPSTSLCKDSSISEFSKHSVTSQCFRKQNQVESSHFESRSLPQGLAYDLGLRYSAYFRRTVWLEGSKHWSQTKFSDLPAQRNHFQRLFSHLFSERATAGLLGTCRAVYFRATAQRTKGWAENPGCGAMVGKTPASHSLTHSHLRLGRF